jgi:type II secretory pathway pseudopilin PulG
MNRSQSATRHGWSLIELTIILVVLSVLCAILVPVIDRYVRNAKVVRAREDVSAIGSSIWMFIEDTANSYFLRDGSPNPALGASRLGGSAPDQSTANRVEMLVSDGDIPELGRDGDYRWALRVNFTDIDFLEYHLVTNRPGNFEANAYRTPTDLGKGATDFPSDPMFARDESGGFNSEFAWRGPYITAPVDPDPWGNRYAVNARYLDPQASSGNTTSEDGTGLGNGYEQDVVVLSAGPDEEIDTDFNIDGITPGDDDILVTISSNSRP